MRGTANVLQSVVRDLRQHQPLVDLLPNGDRNAIYQSFVMDNRGFPVEVTVSPVFEGSTPHRGILQRDYRVQVTVKATGSWRQEMDATSGTNSTLWLHEILTEVANRLDRAPGIEETAQGGEGSPQPRLMEDGRLGMIGDWLVAGWYDDPPPPGRTYDSR
jgi:hypothetical protein